MKPTPFLTPFYGLLISRKFWMAMIALLVAVYLFFTGAITADVLAEALVTLAAIVIGAIALEDAAEKHAATYITEEAATAQEEQNAIRFNNNGRSQ